jgi:ribosomal protein S18 acetylase RimI-like enzyme
VKDEKYEVIMKLEKATVKDIDMLTELRIAYLQEDLGVISGKDLEVIQGSLPLYYEKHLNKDLIVYVARNEMDIVSCAFLLIVEKPMSPSFITGKTGNVLNVYTKPEYRKKGYAKKLMIMMLENAEADGVSVIELKATEDGYSLYKSVGFEDVVAKYHNMKIVL